MARLLLLSALVLILALSFASAQSRSRQRLNYTSIEVRVRLAYSNLNAVARDLSVQLNDQFGVPSTMHEMKTDSNGEVIFRNVRPGIYRVLVKGSNIEDTIGPSFEVLGYSNTHQEIFQVAAKRSSAQLIGTAPVSAASLKIPKKALAELEKGSNALSAGNWKEARSRFEKTINIYPDASDAYNGLGVVNMQEGKNEEGRIAFQKALELDPDSPRAYINLARIYDGEKNFPEVDRLLGKYVSLVPPTAEVLLMLSKAQAAGGKLDMALDNCRKVHNIPHKEQSHAHLLAARILSRRNLADEAMQEYSIFMKEAPNDSNTQEAKRMIQTLRGAADKRPK